MIELEGDLNLPEGQQVTVIVQPVLSPEEAIRQSFGGWAEDAEELDKFLEGLRRDRQQERPEPAQ
jgi:predicted DNA-binding antitoxin AbrB/MazE fold protein